MELWARMKSQQPAMAGLEQPAIQLPRHEGPRSVPRSSPKRTISATSPTARQTDSRVARWLSSRASSRRSTLAFLQQEIHQEVVQPPQEGAPLEQVAPDDHHDRPVGAAAQFQGPLAQKAPEPRRLDVVPGGVRQRRPNDRSHGAAQTRLVGGPAIHPGEVRLIEEGAPGGHAPHGERVPVGGPGPVGLRLGAKPVRVLRRIAVGEPDVVPVLVPVVERAPTSTTSMPNRSRNQSSGCASCCTTS